MNQCGSNFLNHRIVVKLVIKFRQHARTERTTSFRLRGLWPKDFSLSVKTQCTVPPRTNVPRFRVEHDFSDER
jgi:hypothetical protein